jgi:hypothetical protein
MGRSEIKNKLIELQKEIEDYATYLEESTYHPYERVEKFANELKIIIKDFDD